MQELRPIPNNEFYLYDAYRGITEKKHPYAAGVDNSLRQFANKTFYNPEDPKGTMLITREDDGSYKRRTGLHGYDDFIIPLYREGIALAHVFGNRYAEEKMGEELTEALHNWGIRLGGTQLTTWQDIYKNIYKTTTLSEDEFDDISGKGYVYAAFEAVRLQSALVFMRDAGEISDEQFHGAFKAVNASMDRLGLNGIERLLETRPELEEAFASDARKIFLTTEHRSGVRQSYNSFDQENIPTYVTELSTTQWMERGRYFTLMRDNICKTPLAKEKLIRRMMGDEYIAAFNDRIDTFRPYVLEAKGTLSTPMSELNTIILSKDVPEELMDRTLKTFLINYGVGIDHERLQEIRGRFGAAQSQEATVNKTLVIPQTSGNEPRQALLEMHNVDATKKNWRDWARRKWDEIRGKGDPST